MRKKIIKMTFLILVLNLLINIILIPDALAVSWEDIQKYADDFVSSGQSGGTLEVSTLKTTIESVGQILTTIGLAVVMVGILIIGIKYMMASPEEAAKLKGQLVGLVVSAIVIFGAWSIWNITINFFKSVGVK